VAAIFRFSIGERTQTADPSSSARPACPGRAFLYFALGVGFGRHSFIALQDGVLQRTSSILQLFCNEPLLLAYLSVM
jgi:hypothetical protein